MWTEETARRLATAVHSGQVDKAGAEYIQHPARVAASVKSAGGSRFQVMAAWLHDVVEDSALTVEDLAEMGCPPETTGIVEALTKKKGQSSTDYYAGIVAVGPEAVMVKGKDIEDNTDPDRLALLEPAMRERLTKKYEVAVAALGLEG